MTFELKPYQRVKMRNGREGIVVANPLTSSGEGHTEATLLIVLHPKNCHSNGYMPGKMAYGFDCPGWDVVGVWEAPIFYGDLLDFDRKGFCLYQEESKELAQAKADVDTAKTLLAAAEDRLKAAVEASK